MTDIERLGVGHRMCQAVVFENTVWLSGQCGDAFASVREQTEQALRKVEERLAEAGSNKTRLLTTTIYLADISDYDAINEVWDAWIPAECAPARACVEAKMAGDGYAIEIVCIASR